MGTTSLLLKLTKAAMLDEEVDGYMSQIEETHHEIIKGLIKDATCRFEAQSHVYDELQRLSAFLDALRVIQEVSSRSHDMIIGVGERLSAGVLAAALRSEGVKAQYFDLSSLCKEVDSQIPGYHIAIQAALGELLEGKVGAMGAARVSGTRGKHGTVPILTGFLGHYKGGIVEAVGRGYSDHTAAMVAAEMKAKELQVWKEVDGIFSANPKIVKEAHVLSSVTPVEAAELTYFGSEVLHPFTMNVAISKGVPIRIKNTFAPELPGTAVFPPGMISEEEKERDIQELENTQYGAKAVTSKIA